MSRRNPHQGPHRWVVIKHLPSGGYLPVSDRKTRGSKTWVEPSTLSPPRIFPSAAAAKRFLWFYLQGGWGTRNTTREGEGFEPPETITSIEVVDATKKRNPDDFRIIRIHIEELPG